MLKHLGLATILGFCALPLFGQCAGKTGFALASCQAQNGQANNSGSGLLTTSYSDAIHGNTLPAGLDLTGPKPIDKLERSDDGSFVLAAGIYEETVESFSLDAGNAGFNKNGDLFPAPLRGSIAAIVVRVLKYAELHPEVTHDDIQQLLSGIVAGTELGKMSPQAQHAANVLLTKDQIALLHPAPAKPPKSSSSAVGGWLDRERDAVVGAALGRVQTQVNTASQKAGVPGAVVMPSTGEVTQQTNTVAPAQQDAGAAYAASIAAMYQASYQGVMAKTPGGRWVEMKDGYYLRYVPDGPGRMKVQLVVPDGTISSGNQIHFDPTLLVAVTSSTPGHRYGITMRSQAQPWQ